MSPPLKESVLCHLLKQSFCTLSAFLVAYNGRESEAPIIQIPAMLVSFTPFLCVLISLKPLLPVLCWNYPSVWFSSVQLLSSVKLITTPWTAARQASLSFTISWNLLKLKFIELVMPSNHFIFRGHLLLLPSIH